MRTKIRQQLRAAKRRIERRLDKSKLGDCAEPVLVGGNVHYELAERTHGMTYGGIGAMTLLVKRRDRADHPRRGTAARRRRHLHVQDPGGGLCVR